MQPTLTAAAILQRDNQPDQAAVAQNAPDAVHNPDPDHV